MFCDYHSSCLDCELAKERADGMQILTESLLYERMPPHVVGLVEGGRDSPMFLLDTVKGVVHWSNAPDRPCDFPMREQEDLEESEDEKAETKSKMRTKRKRAGKKKLGRRSWSCLGDY